MTARGVAEAQALIDVRRYDEAAEAARRALVEEPDSYRALCLLALAELNAGRDVAAREAAGRAIAVRPDADWGHRLHASACIRGGLWADAEDSARRAVEVAPLEPLTHVVLASALKERSDFDGAFAAAERARELAPASATARATLGEVALRSGDNERAVKELEGALELDPTDAHVLNDLGVALLRLGRRKQALEVFNRAAAIDPRLHLARRNVSVAARAFLNRGLPIALLGYLGVRFAVIAGLHTHNGWKWVGGLIAFAAAISLFMYMRRRAALQPHVRELLRDERRRQMRDTPRTLRWVVAHTAMRVLVILGSLALLWLIASEIREPSTALLVVAAVDLAVVVATVWLIERLRHPEEPKPRTVELVLRAAALVRRRRAATR